MSKRKKRSKLPQTPTPTLPPDVREYVSECSWEIVDDLLTEAAPEDAYAEHAPTDLGLALWRSGASEPGRSPRSASEAGSGQEAG